MNDKKLESLFGIKRGQEPKTRFVDNLSAVKVALVDWPDEERLKRTFVNMAKASWWEDFFDDASEEDVEEAVESQKPKVLLDQRMYH